MPRDGLPVRKPKAGGTPTHEAVAALRTLTAVDLFELAPDALVMTDQTGIIVLVNSKAGRMFGWRDAELLGESVETLVPTSGEEGQPQRRTEYVHGVGSRRMARQKGGGRFPAAISSSQIELEGEQFVVTAVRDLSERIQLETRTLQTQKLETVGRLASDIAHDFNNLILVINTSADLAARKLGDAHPVTDDLTLIRRSGEKAAQLTQQILAFSRQQTLQPRVVDLNVIIRELTAMLRRLIGEDITMILKLGGDLSHVKIDPTQFEQALANLVTNGRDAMPSGGKLFIETAEVQLDQTSRMGGFYVQPGPYVMVIVSDTGEGMDDKTRSKIFEPFFTTREMGKGTGLGLSTTYGIVKQNGGYIWCYSEVGRGTTFKIFLPRYAGDEAPIVSRQKEQQAAGGDETILLVEDDVSVRSVVCRILEAAGYTVLQADSGEMAVKIAAGSRGQIQLVVSDVVMPGMSLKEMTERLREEHANVRFLFTSGYAGERIAQEGVLESDAQFISKPYSAESLEVKIRSALDL